MLQKRVELAFWHLPPGLLRDATFGIVPQKPRTRCVCPRRWNQEWHCQLAPWCKWCLTRQTGGGIRSVFDHLKALRPSVCNLNPPNRRRWSIYPVFVLKDNWHGNPIRPHLTLKRQSVHRWNLWDDRRLKTCEEWRTISILIQKIFHGLNPSRKRLVSAISVCVCVRPGTSLLDDVFAIGTWMSSQRSCEGVR